MSFGYFSRNHVILPEKEAVVRLDNLAYAYGFGVYETMKVRKGIVYFARQHAARLLHSASCIGLEHTENEETIAASVRGLVDYLKVTACNIKILLIGGETARDAQLYIFATAPLYPNRKLYRDGATTITAVYERWMPQAKSLNMLPSYLLYREAQRQGCYDCLLVDYNGNIREGTRTNFFVMRGRTIISPPAEHILEGVTRRTILYVMQQHGFAYAEQPISVSELAGCDAVFLSSTSSKIMPVRRVDSMSFSISEQLRRLMKAYDIFLDGCGGIFPE